MIFDTTKLKDTNTKLRYQLKVRNRFASLKETDDIEVSYGKTSKMLYILLQTQLLVGDEVPQRAVDIE